MSYAIVAIKNEIINKMATQKDHILAMAKSGFLNKINLISWEAAQWMQLIDIKSDERDNIIFTFKSSSFGVGFEVYVKQFYDLYGCDWLSFDYMETYNFFKRAKYNEAKRLK